MKWSKYQFSKSSFVEKIAKKLSKLKNPKQNHRAYCKKRKQVFKDMNNLVVYLNNLDMCAYTSCD